jgi:hypothetical protein
LEFVAYIDGKTMIRAVKNMADLVVGQTVRQYPGTISNNHYRSQHVYVIVATLVEAIYALQHDSASDFRDAASRFQR